MTDRVLTALVFFSIITASFGWGIYCFTRNYKECRAVPHTVFYCLTANS